MKNLQQALQQRQQQGLYRRRHILQGPQGRQIQLDGQTLLNFSSNDYLGLSNHPAVKQAFIDAAQRHGVGSGSAHLVNGHSEAHHQLEQALAEFTGYPRALLFSTGYMANLAVAQSLCGRGDFIVEDKLNHASLLDAAQLSGGRLLRYPHKDHTQLQNRLQQCDNGEILLCSDAVFSMDGDEADIASLVSLSQQHQSWLMLDDAHGFGVLGENGRGSLSRQQISNADVPIYMATLGKALGTAGAFIAGSEELIEYLIQHARSYIYTTAMPAAVAAATLCSLQLLTTEAHRRQQLAENIALFRQLAAARGIVLMPSDTAIQPVPIGDAERASQLSEALFTRGFHLAAIRPPTVPANSARLRITLRADHQQGDMISLLDALAELLDQRQNQPR